MDNAETIVRSSQTNQVFSWVERIHRLKADAFSGGNLSISASCMDRERLVDLMLPFDPGAPLVDVRTRPDLVAGGLRLASVSDIFPRWVEQRYQGAIEIRISPSVLMVGTLAPQDGSCALMLGFEKVRHLDPVILTAILGALGLEGPVLSSVVEHVSADKPLIQQHREPFFFNFIVDDLTVNRSFDDWAHLYQALGEIGASLERVLPGTSPLSWYPTVKLCQLQELTLKPKKLFFMFNYALRQYWEMSPASVSRLIPVDVGEMSKGEWLRFRWSTIGEHMGAPFDSLDVLYRFREWSLELSGESRRKIRTLAEEVKGALGLS